LGEGYLLLRGREGNGMGKGKGGDGKGKGRKGKERKGKEKERERRGGREGRLASHTIFRPWFKARFFQIISFAYFDSRSLMSTTAACRRSK